MCDVYYDSDANKVGETFSPCFFFLKKKNYEPYESVIFSFFLFSSAPLTNFIEGEGWGGERGGRGKNLTIIEVGNHVDYMGRKALAFDFSVPKSCERPALNDIHDNL